MAKHRVRRRNRDRQGVRLLKLPDGRHVARWDDPLDGKTRQQSLDRLGLTTAEARRSWAMQKSQALNKLRAKVAVGGAAAARTAVADAIDDFLAGYRVTTTATAYRSGLAEFKGWAETAGVKDLASLTPTMIPNFRDAVVKAPALAPSKGKRGRGKRVEAERGRKPRTVNRILRTVKTFLFWCQERGLVPALSGDDIRRKLKPLRAERDIRFLHPPQIRKLLEAALRHDYETYKLTRAEHDGHVEPGSTTRYAPIAPVVLGALLTGCRFGELLGLKWSDYEGGSIWLPASRVKTGRARVVHLTETPSMARLLDAMSLRRSGDRVFGDMSRSRAESARRRLIERYGAPKFTWQDLRRTCGTILANASSVHGAASAFMSAKRLGHSVTVAESAYVDQLRGLPSDAKTLEAAAGIEDLAEEIVESVGAVVPSEATAAV